MVVSWEPSAANTVTVARRVALKACSTSGSSVAYQAVSTENAITAQTAPTVPHFNDLANVHLTARHRPPWRFGALAAALAPAFLGSLALFLRTFTMPGMITHAG